MTRAGCYSGASYFATISSKVTLGECSVTGEPQWGGR